MSVPCLLAAWLAYEPELRSFLRQRSSVADEVDDLLQEIFFKALRQGSQFCAVENTRAWFFQVARNLMADRWRVTKEQVPLPDDLPAESVAEAEAVDLLTHCLPRVLSELSPEDREAISLCDIGGMAQSEYARHLGLSLPAAKSRLRRARLRLRARLSKACQLKFDEAGRVCCFVPRPALESGSAE